MARSKIQHSEEELTRKIEYMIVTAGNDMQPHVIDIQEGKLYVEKYKTRSSILIPSDRQTDFEIEKVAAPLCMNIVNKFRQIQFSDELTIPETIEMILKRFKNGQVIIHQQTDFDYNKIELQDAGIDFIVHKKNVIDIVEAEKRLITAIRFHRDEEFDFEIENLQAIESIYDNYAFGIFLAQYIANYKYFMFDNFMKEQKKLYEGIDREFDERDISLQKNDCIYFKLDGEVGKLINCSKKLFEDAFRKFIVHILPMPQINEEQIFQTIENYTV